MPKTETNQRKELHDRMQAMGVPTPVGNTAPAMPVKATPETIRRIEEIKRGHLKSEIMPIVSKMEPKSNIPVPPQKQQSQKRQPQRPGSPEAPPLQEFSAPNTNVNAEANQMESMLYGGGAPTRQSSPVDSSIDPAEAINSLSYTGPSSVDYGQRVKSTVSSMGASVDNMVKPEPSQKRLIEEGRHSGAIDIDTRVKTIATSVAKTVSKKMIIELLKEAAKGTGGLFVETKTTKKATLLGRERIEIGGKKYKVTRDNDS